MRHRWLFVGALALPVLGGCALFFPQQSQGAGAPASSANAQASRAEQLEQMRAQARTGGADAQMQWAAYVSGVVGSPEAKAAYGEEVAWAEIEAEALAMMDALAAGDDPDLALRATGVQAQLLMATGQGAAAVAAFEELHAAAPSYDTAVSLLVVSEQAAAPLEDPVGFCRSQRELATSDPQLYGFMNACLRAHQAAGGPGDLAGGLPWATKRDFEVYARVDAAMIAERQRQAAAQEEEARRAEAARREQELERERSMAAGSASGGGGGASAPAGPVVVSITLRNRCRETVKLFFGDKPKFGSGTYSSLGGNSSTSRQFREGDMIWVVDDGQNGLSSTTVSRGARTVEITESCTGMTTR